MVTASIVVHKTPPEQLLTAIACLQRSQAVSRIMVIDNSPDDSLRAAVGGCDKVEYHHVENRGFGAGHNIAIREALAEGSSYHLVMNADVRWEGDVIEPLVNYMEQRPEVGLVSPKVYYPDGDLQYSCRMLPTPWDVFAKRFVPRQLIARRMRRYLLADADHEREFFCPYLLGSFMFFRTSCFAEAGMFDERFFMYPEDIDISRRISERYDTMFYPGVTIIHDHAAASRKNGRMLRIHIVNMIRYFNKWGWIIDRRRRALNKRLRASVRKATVPVKGRG